MGFGRVFISCTEFQWDFMIFNGFRTGSTGFHMALTAFIGFLLGLTGFDWDFIGFYWVGHWVLIYWGRARRGLAFQQSPATDGMNGFDDVGSVRMALRLLLAFFFIDDP